MKPEWCPQWAWDEAEKAIPTYHDYAVSFARALLDAHRRGKCEGLEEAARAAQDEFEQARAYHPEVALGAKFARDAIRAKALEIKT